jgi:arylformamidase
MSDGRANALVDLSQPYFNGMSTSKAHGVPTFRTRALVTSLPTDIAITDVSMSAHIGTHVDAPRHFFPGGRTIDEYPVDRFRGSGVVLDVRRHGPVPVTAEELSPIVADIRAGDFVLFCFGYGRLFGTPDYPDHPYLSDDVADLLVDQGVTTVGVDVPTPDRPEDSRGPGFAWPVHHRLLGNDVLIIENLGANLERLIGQRVDISAPPLAIRGGDGAPARVTASVLPDPSRNRGGPCP